MYSLDFLNIKTLIFTAMIIISMTIFLAFVCIVIWLCFWQMELAGNRRSDCPASNKNSAKYYGAMDVVKSGGCILKRRHQTEVLSWLVDWTFYIRHSFTFSWEIITLNYKWMKCNVESNWITQGTTYDITTIHSSHY